MESPYLLAALLAIGVAGCKTEVSTTPATSTTKIEVKPAEPPPPSTVVVTPPATTTETTKSTTITSPSGRTATTTTTETKK